MKTQIVLCCALLTSASVASISSLAGEPAAPPAPTRPEKAQETLTGVVKEKKDSQVLVKRDDGQGEVKVRLDENVQVTKNDLPASPSDLVQGVHVEIRVKLKGQTLGAVTIRILAADSKLIK